MKRISAFIFDFDGVLIDSMGMHFICVREVCAEAGIPIDEDELAPFAGVPVIEQIRYFAEKAKANIDVMDIFRRHEELFNERIDQMELITSNHILINALYESGMKVAIASSSATGTILPFIEKYGIPYDALVTIMDVKAGKPSPDLFLAAAKRLGVPTDECVVVEDSDAGVEAAMRAGMQILRYIPGN